MEKDSVETLTNQAWNNEDNLGDQYYSLTQDNYNEVDVVWDWNSPQAKRKPQAQPRYVCTIPKVPLKRHPSNSQAQSYERLKEELESLKEELAINSQKENHKTFENNEIDIFDDSIDEQLELLSKHLCETHEIPSVVSLEKVNVNSGKPDFLGKVNVDNSKASLGEVVNSDKKINRLNIPRLPITTSVSIITPQYQLSTIPENDKQTGQTEKNRCLSRNSITRTKSEDSGSSIRMTDRSIFQRTRSFEVTEGSISKQKLAEIEKRRLEALAKLETKRKLGNSEAIKCSPGEIERKRLLALQKLEAKRQQELIEKKHKEALERLKQSKKRYPLASQNQK